MAPPEVLVAERGQNAGLFEVLFEVLGLFDYWTWYPVNVVATDYTSELILYKLGLYACDFCTFLHVFYTLIKSLKIKN